MAKSNAIATETATKNFYAGGLESPTTQKILGRINKATADKPLVASKAFGKKQYPNRVARMLATLGLVKQEKREDLGVVFFAKPAKAARAPRQPKAQVQEQATV